MEQATTPRPLLAGSARIAPPASRRPGWIQGLSYTRDPIGFYVRLYQRHGDVFSVKFPYFGRVVYVANPEIVKRIFAGDPAQFHAGEANATVLEPALGPNSVLTLDEDAHMRQRKLLLPPFHGDRIVRYGEVMKEVAEQEIAKWPVGEPFALRSATERITLAVILQTVYGVRDEERFRRAAALVGEFARRVDLVTQIPPLRRNLGKWSPWGRFLRARSALDEMVYEEIAARRVEIGAAAHGREAERAASVWDVEDGAGGDGRDDVLSLLMRAEHDDGSPMSDEELRDELVTVVGAGHETTATALAWAMERLLRTPRVMAKLRESLAVGEDEYLDAVIQETLRIRPVIVDVARKLTAPAEIGGYELPAGTMVLPAIAAMHFRPDLYPDPEEFRPERFIEGKPDHFAWIPFGGGVRRCVGAAFAQYEMKVVLKAILDNAELSATDPRPERMKARNITVAPGNGCRVRLERRLQPPV